MGVYGFKFYIAKAKIYFFKSSFLFLILTKATKAVALDVDPGENGETMQIVIEITDPVKSEMKGAWNNGECPEERQ